MYTTSYQISTAAINLTDTLDNFFTELMHLIFALIDTLIDCTMYSFDRVTSNPMLLVTFVVCFVYYVHRKYYVCDGKVNRVRK